MKSKIIVYSFAIFSVIILFTNCSDSNIDFEETLEVDKSAFTTLDADSSALSEAEIAGLYFMREEEKLAHDVYFVLNTLFPHQTFKNISKSEQLHTDAILHLINYYDLKDPAKDEVGEFTDPELQELYDALIDLGSHNLDSALTVGAIIEETDIIDIEEKAHEACAENIIQVYCHLLDGSENHLRAFVYALNQIGIDYTPRFITQERFDEIINE